MLIAPAILFGAGLMLPGCTSCSLNGGWERQMNPFCVESRPDRPPAPAIQPPVAAPGLVKPLPIVSSRRCRPKDQTCRPASVQGTPRARRREVPIPAPGAGRAPLVYAAAPAPHLSPEEPFSNETFFGENDQERRLGACHDEYGFSGQVALDAEVPCRPPDLTYVTNAWAYPRRASREEDSTERARLEQSDLVREQDPECSFSRHFSFQPETRAYEPETPLPECSAYTVP